MLLQYSSSLPLQCAEAGGPVGPSLVVHVVPIAHGSISYFFVSFLARAAVDELRCPF